MIFKEAEILSRKMDGKAFKVGRFAHTLRVRLMREHLGVDVDAMYEEDLMTAAEPVASSERDTRLWDPDNEQQREMRGGVTRVRQRRGDDHHRNPVTDGFKEAAAKCSLGEIIHRMSVKGKGLDSALDEDEKALEEARVGYDRESNRQSKVESLLAPTLEEKIVMEHRPQTAAKSVPGDIDEDVLYAKRHGAAEHGDEATQTVEDATTPEVRVRDGSGVDNDASSDVSNDAHDGVQPLQHARQGGEDGLGLGNVEKDAVRARSVLRKHVSSSSRVGGGGGGGAAAAAERWTLAVPGPVVDPYRFEDPICDGFYKDVWVAAAVHNVS